MAVLPADIPDAPVPLVNEKIHHFFGNAGQVDVDRIHRLAVIGMVYIDQMRRQAADIFNGFW